MEVDSEIQIETKGFNDEDKEAVKSGKPVHVVDDQYQYYLTPKNDGLPVIMRSWNKGIEGFERQLTQYSFRMDDGKIDELFTDLHQDFITQNPEHRQLTLEDYKRALVVDNMWALFRKMYNGQRDWAYEVEDNFTNSRVVSLLGDLGCHPKEDEITPYKRWAIQKKFFMNDYTEFVAKCEESLNTTVDTTKIFKDLMFFIHIRIHRDDF